VKFRCIVADPPWSFGDKLPGGGRGAVKHYACLTLAELCCFPLPPIADDAVLFLWRVASMQQEALAVARAWGFNAPTSEIVWCKPQMGMGRTVRNCHEVALICRRGKPTRLDAGVRSFFTAPRTEHSAKPDEFFALVERLYPGPRVELFARKHREGWTCMGNEVDGRAAAEQEVAQ
jgi:N6-adenosine-specific RNA methylase IME4